MVKLAEAADADKGFADAVAKARRVHVFEGVLRYSQFCSCNSQFPIDVVG